MNAQESLNQEKAIALLILEQLTDAVNEYGNNENVNYGHCGSMQKVKSDLYNIAQFLNVNVHKRIMFIDPATHDSEVAVASLMNTIKNGLRLCVDKNDVPPELHDKLTVDEDGNTIDIMLI